MVVNCLPRRKKRKPMNHEINCLPNNWGATELTINILMEKRIKRLMAVESQCLVNTSYLYFLDFKRSFLDTDSKGFLQDLSFKIFWPIKSSDFYLGMEIKLVFFS